jgi:hypothetical protein
MRGVSSFVPAFVYQYVIFFGVRPMSDVVGYSASCRHAGALLSR